MNEVESDFKHSMGVCADKIYLHIYADLQSHSISHTSENNEESKNNFTIGTLITNYNYSKQCSSHISKDDDLALKCATMSEKKCSLNDECDEQCQWILCAYNSINQKDVFKEFTLCVPANIYAEDQICYDHYDFVNSPNKRFSFKKCGYPLNSYKMPGKEGITVGTVTIIVLLILILLFIASILYYRWSLSKKKYAPFTPPNFCPDWIYPKVEIEFPRKLRPMIKKDEYKPPDD